MKKFVIPTLTFIGGCGLGAYAGVKGFAVWLKKYIRSDECKSYMEKELNKIFDEEFEKRYGG